MEFSIVLKKKVHSDCVRNIAFHPLDSDLVVSISGDKKIILSSMKDGKVVWENDEMNAEIFCVRFNQNGKWVAGVGSNNRLMVMDAKTGKSFSMVDVSSWILGLAFRSDDKIVCGLYNGTVILVNWQLQSKSVEKTIQVSDEPIYSIALSPLSDDLVMVGDDDSAIKLINLRKEIVIREYEKHSNTVLSLRFNEDGSKFVSGSRDGSARLYSMDQINPIMNYEGHSDAVKFAGLLHDDERLITCSFDGIIKLWNVHSGKCLLTTKANGDVFCADVSKDEKYIAVGDWDGSIKIYLCPARPTLALDGSLKIEFVNSTIRKKKKKVSSIIGEKRIFDKI